MYVHGTLAVSSVRISLKQPNNNRQQTTQKTTTAIMIPPCDPTVLENNPQFKKLHQQLTTTLLDADGSTCANNAQPERRAVLEVRYVLG